MAPIFRTHRNQLWDEDGNLVEDEEIQEDVTVEVNGDALHQAARNALAANRAFVASTPTAAQSTAQVKALSRQMNGLIRLLLNELDGTD